MKERLVRVNADGLLLEIDPLRLRRVATELRDAILKGIPTNRDDFGLRSLTLPFVERVLEGKEELPCVDSLRFESGELKWQEREFGLGPDLATITKALAPFYCVVSGLKFARNPIEEVNGERYVREEYEEPGDWPEVVLAREQFWSEELARLIENDRIPTG
jgi:hypothetical protein